MCRFTWIWTELPEATFSLTPTPLCSPLNEVKLTLAKWWGGCYKQFACSGETRHNRCWFKEHFRPENVARFCTQIEVYPNRDEGWFIRLRHSDEIFCRRDILTHVSDGPYSRPCKLLTPTFPPPYFFLFLRMNHKRLLLPCESSTNPLLKL
jgi:hypothetical protein